MYALVDCNNFFVSCERLFNPSLNDRPVVVFSGNDGCVIARSNEAKALGIGMGQPAFELRELFEREKVALFSSNHILYGDISRRVMSVLSQFSPEVEVYSIDEAFLVLDGITMPYGAEVYARTIAETVMRCVGIPVSVGIAPTKTLAKIASHRAKKIARYGGVCHLATPDQQAIALMECPIGDVWGIGRRLAPKLLEQGVSTAWDFSRLPRERVRRLYTVEGERTWRELNGEVCYSVDELPASRLSVTVSRTFGQAVTTFDDVYEAVANFTSTAAQRLRRQGSAAGAVMVFVKGRGCSPGCYMGALQCTLPVASDSTIELLQYARKALVGVYRRGEAYKKAGVILQHIVPREHVQLSLFDTVDREKHHRLMQVMDSVNKQVGSKVLRLGAESGRQVWQAQRSHLSPCYTTSFSDILVVKAHEK
ncbi:MAG: Y-family DNA polymerase [Bacteroidaceae bacterium]|nr:Y-family DNA polymerase [Bacteroidaceae bacterium]